MFHKVGLAFAGGGGKGAYQIGVWKALREFGIERNIQAVAGTSVGGLNAVLFLEGDLQKAQDLWLSINPRHILDLESGTILDRFRELNISGNISRKNLYKWSKKVAKNGLYTRQGLIDIINKKIDLSAIRKAKAPCFVTTTKIPDMEPAYFQLNGKSEDRILTILLATSALPGIFPPENIDDKRYIDGGLVDNFTIKPLYDLGCDIIIIVYLNRIDKIDYDRFPEARFLEIIPEKDQGGLLSGVLNFQPEVAARRIKEGYEDSKELLTPLNDLTDNLYQMVESLGKYRHNPLRVELKRRDVYNKFDFTDQIVKILNRD